MSILRRSLLLLAIGAVAAVARAQSGLVLPPGLELEVRRLVLPAEGEGPLDDGHDVRSAQIGADRIVVRLGRGDSEIAAVWLAPRGARYEAVHAGDTPSFSVWIVEGGGAPALRAVEALRRRIASRDEGTFWDAAVAPGSPASAPRTPNATQVGRIFAADWWLTWLVDWYAPGALPALEALASYAGRRLEQRGGPVVAAMRVEPALTALLWATLLVSVGLVVSGQRSAFWAPSRTQRVSLVLLFALALVLRLSVPPWAPLHANQHGIAELRGLGGGPGEGDDESAQYGRAYPVLVRALLSPLGGGADAALALGALFGALAVLLLALLVRRLMPGRPWGPPLAALALAVHPAHVRLSLSENPRPLAGALLLLGILLALRTRGPAATAAAVGSGAALALAAQLREITPALPFAAALLVFSLTRPTRRLLAAALLPAAAVALHLVVLAPAFEAAGQRRWFYWGHRMWGEQNLFFNSQLAAPLLVPLAITGAILFWRTRRRRVVVGSAAAIAVLVPISLFICASRTDAIRYQSEAHLFACVLVAGVAMVRSPRVPMAAGLALGVASIPGLRDIARPDIQEQAFAIARAAPATARTIVVPPRLMSGDPRVRSEFPEYLVGGPGRIRRELPENREGCVVWIGPPCSSYSPEEWPGTGIRAECAALAENVAALPTFDVPHREWEFLTIVGRPPIGFARCRG